MSMLMLFGQMLGRGVFVQLVSRVFVLVLGFLACGVRMAVRMLVRVGVLVSMRVDRAFSMPVFVAVNVRVDVGVQVFVLDLGRHDMPPLSCVEPPGTLRGRRIRCWKQVSNSTLGCVERPVYGRTERTG
jgi:hypothetical protein